jgi:hypothetical protein
MSETPTTAKPEQPSTEEPKPESFTQSDVDRIVADRLKREREATKAKFGDYEDLKAKAAGAKTVKDRVAELERLTTEAEARALRAEVANAKGLTPGQAKRLVGSNREELEADAEELLKDIGKQRSKNNVTPSEGKTPQSGKDTSDRAFVRELFGRANAD